MKNLIIIINIVFSFRNELLSQKKVDVFEHEILIDTVFNMEMSNTKMKILTYDFPQYCCCEDSIKFNINVIFNQKQFLENIEISKISYKKQGINSIIIANFCNNCNDIDFQVSLFEFCLNTEHNAIKLLKKLEKINNKKEYSPFGKNWFLKRINNNIYFLKAYLDDEVNKTKVELTKRISFLE